MNKSQSSVSGKAKYKIVFLGEQNTGKTSIIERFINDKFDQKSNPTIGIDFLGKNIAYKNQNYRLQLWDTAGQQRFRSLIPSYLKDAVCAIYVFDLSNFDSLNNIQKWINLFKENRGPQTVSVLCGNKLDLHPNFDESKVATILSREGMPFYQVSACTGENIEAMFFGAIEAINKVLSQRIKPAANAQTNNNNDNKKKASSIFNETATELPPMSREPIKIDNKKDEEANTEIKKRKCCGGG